MNKSIIFYGAEWCADCYRVQMFLDESNIKYEYIDIDYDEEAAEEVIRINKGYRSIPTLVFPSGKVLSEPNFTELLKVLSEEKLATE